MERRNKLSIVIVVLAMLGALFATAGIAAGNGPVNFDRGVLLVYTVDNGTRIDWHAADLASPTGYSAAATKTQTIGIDSKCNVTLGTTTATNNASLVTLTPSGGTGQVGMVSHGLGVKTKNNCSTEQGQIALGQTLKIGLGSFFGPRVVMERAEIDVEGKRNAKLGITYTKLSGATATASADLGLTSDNGPDSGTADNNIVVLTPADPFRAVQFHPIMNGQNSPAVSIEGGGDGTVAGGSLRTTLGTNASLFKLAETFDGTLSCGGQAKATNEAGYESTLTRLNTSNGIPMTPSSVTDACATPKPYNFNATTALVKFEPGLSITANYRGDIVLDKRLVGTPPVFQYDRDISTVGPYYDMQLCNLRSLMAPEDPNMFPELPSDKFPTLTGVFDADSVQATWCLVASRSVTLGNGFELHYFVTFGNDDPGWSIR